jgi:putative nucleotidyltransferase with HDIG domain
MKNKEKIFLQLNKSIESEQGNLPIFSAVSVRIQLELIKDQPDLKVIEKLIVEDQALSSTILKLANSVIFSGIVETTTVRSAIMRLGMAEIMQIVCADINNKLFSSLDSQIDAILKQLWQHSVACAYGSAILASNINCGVIKEEAFSAGLFHDIGKLLILKVVEQKKKYYKILDMEDDVLLESINALHAKYGYMIMQKMKLPKIYSVVARDHHLKKFDKNNFLLIMVRLANNICHKVGIGIVQEPSIDIMATEEAVLLNLSEEMLSKLEKFIINNPAIAELTGKA